MNDTPTLTPEAEAMRWLNEIEKTQGGANGPTIKLRAAILALGDPMSATVEAFEAPRSVAEVHRLRQALREDAERWRYWRNYWPALCRMEVARFAGLDLTRVYVQSPADMDAVTDAAMQRKPLTGH
jgi:hypothetical protein